MNIARRAGGVSPLILPAPRGVIVSAGGATKKYEPEGDEVKAPQRDQPAVLASAKELAGHPNGKQDRARELREPEEQAERDFVPQEAIFPA